MLGYARDATLAAVDGLTVADLTHRHDARANSIGALLAHVAATEWFYVTVTLELWQPDGAEWTAWGAALRLGPGAEAAEDELNYRGQMRWLRARLPGAA